MDTNRILVERFHETYQLETSTSVGKHKPFGWAPYDSNFGSTQLAVYPTVVCEQKGPFSKCCRQAGYQREVSFWQCAPKGRITCGGRFPPRELSSGWTCRDDEGPPMAFWLRIATIRASARPDGGLLIRLPQPRIPAEGADVAKWPVSSLTSSRRTLKLSGISCRQRRSCTTVENDPNRPSRRFPIGGISLTAAGSGSRTQSFRHNGHLRNNIGDLCLLSGQRIGAQHGKVGELATLRHDTRETRPESPDNAAVFAQEHGQRVEPVKLVPSMLARFMSTDRAFVRARRAKSDAS